MDLSMMTVVVGTKEDGAGPAFITMTTYDDDETKQLQTRTVDLSQEQLDALGDWLASL